MQLRTSGACRAAGSEVTIVPTLSRFYFTVAYVSLSLAFAAIGVAPRAAGGFFYHARLLGIVHLVTLGWITSVILGALYIAVPTRLNSHWPVRRGDYVALASTVIGLIGMVAHFWIEEYGGMAWSGLMVLAGVGYVVARAWPRIARARHPARLPLLLGMANILAAASAGVLLGFDKVHHFLPGYVISNVLAHAHLAALGWACMMTLGLSWALDPGAREHLTRSFILTFQVAIVGLFGALLTGSRAMGPCAVVAALALLAAAIRLCRTNRDTAGRHTAAALAYLLVAAASGVALASLESSEFTMRLALVYGGAGLLGFLAQMLLAVLLRLEPSMKGNALTFSLWSAGLAALIAGLFLGADRVLAGGAWLAFAGTLLPVVPPVATCLVRPLSWAHAARHRRGPADQLTLSQGRS
jgi:hypothetical protein